MRLTLCGFLFLAGLAGSFANAQTNNLSKIQHVIIVIQENRTPDNLFGSDAVATSPQLPGADLLQLAPNGMPYAKCKSAAKGYAPVTGFRLDACFDPDHGHGNAPNDDAWVTTYDDGAMDGACVSPKTIPSGCNAPTYPQLTYVNNTSDVLQPYFDIAKNYGYANYMFQTNQGPSYPAHQFLFGGTSAPDSDEADQCGAYPCYQWFAAENAKTVDGIFGCTGLSGSDIIEVDPAGVESSGIYNNGFPCYSHKTLADLLDANSISWKYYPQGPNAATSLWTAPNSIESICGPSGGECKGNDWTKYVKPEIPPEPPVKNKMAPILTDIQSCKLSNVSWVIPDGNWSDHPGGCPSGGCLQGVGSGHYLGPAWVADIVNAVGNATKCDSTGYWNDTVILITWDDWGGWYDHLLPWDCTTGGACSGYSNTTGGQYVYGFRVPLAVVSAYNYRPSGATGYISGACGQSALPACPNEAGPYVHDFGSILNFVEWTFGKNQQFLTFPGISTYGINPAYPYADYFAPDVYTSQNCAQSVCPYSLSDFFNFSQLATKFTPIALPAVLKAYTATYFENFGLHNGDPPRADPDDDATEP